MDARRRLLDSRLYLLATTSICHRPLDCVLREVIAGGVDVVQLREKDLPDPDFRGLALWIGRIVRDAGALFILNDRVDVAAAVECDGVHVGQEDASVPEVRAAIGPGKLIGLSTHSREQADEAVALGADYVGIGPTFETSTKETGYPPRGAELAGEVTGALPVPAFAIGGINAANLPDLLAAGTRRIAVSSAICSAADPRAAAAELRGILDREP